MKSLYALLIVITIISCNPKDNSKSGLADGIYPAEPNKFQESEDCYSDRNTVKIVNSTPGKVLKAGKFGVIDCYELGDRYQPCSLPDWAVVDVEVVVSGVVKEIFENERREGSPFLISEIGPK